MKKILCMLLTGALVLSCVSGCGKTNQQSGKENTSNIQQENDLISDEKQEAAGNVDVTNSESTEKNWEEKAKITLGDTILVEGSGAEVKENVLVISQGGSYELTGTLADGMIYIETEAAVKLVLNHANISNTTGPAIFGYDSEEVWIETVEGTENILEDGAAYAEAYENTSDGERDDETDSTEEEETGKGTIFSNDDLIFTGKGTLTINGNYKHGICSDDSVYFQGGNYVLSAVKDGVQANDDLVVNGGSIVVTSCEEGLESKANMYINGGTVEITGSDDGLNTAALLQINGGIVYADISKGDAMDSNGNLEINGGIVVALGSDMPEGGADCDDNEFMINGGILIATGGTNSSPSENKSTQASVLLGAANVGDVLGILDAEGNTVFAFEVSKAYSNMLLSGDFLTTGSSYTVYTGGSVAGNENVHGYYAETQYTGGTESATFTVDGMVVSAGGSAGMPGGMGGGKGQFPGGELPEGMEPPEGMERTELPEGEFPEGMEPPEGMERPEGNRFPQGQQMPENGNGIELPEGTEIPEQNSPMENGGQPQGDKTI